MTSHPGNIPSEFRPLPPCPPLSSLSPLAAPFKANGARPLGSDPIHNPAPSLGPAAPTMLHSSQHQRSIPADSFLFGSGIDGVSAGGAPQYYPPYQPWKPSWAPDDGADGSGSWIDPSHSYPLSSTDKGSAATIASKHYEQSQIPPIGPHTSHLSSTYQCIREAHSWKGDQEPSFYSTGSALSKGSRSSGMGLSLKEPSSAPLPNASLSSVVGHADIFSNGFQSSVVAPMLNNISDSFSLDAGSSKGYYGLPSDKYMTQLESHSTQSHMDPSPPTSGPGNVLGAGPIDPLVNCTSGFSSVHYGNPLRISMEYFDYLPQEIKDPVAQSTATRSKVKITAPIAKSPAIKRDSEVVEPRELDIKCRVGNAKSGNPGTGFVLDSLGLEVLDEQSVVLDSPCWKGMPSSSQSVFSKKHTGNSCNVPFENEIPSGNLLPSETSQNNKLGTVTTGLVNPSEEKAIEENVNQNFKTENRQGKVSSNNDVKDEKGKGLVSTVLPDIVGPQIDVMLLIKSMHGLSQTLLTSCGGDGFELKEHKLELLQMAMDNLKSFTVRRNKLKTDYGGPASSTKNPEEISDGTDNRTTTNEANDNHINVAPRLTDTKYKKSVLEALNQTTEEDSEVQAELYKNLWIEAEASLCAMKYELQLARTKLKMKSQKHDQEANSSSMLEAASDSFSDPKPSSSVQTVGATALSKQTLWDLNYPMSEEKDTEGHVSDPAVMARFRIIKGRMDNMESQDQRNAEKSLEENISLQNKDFSSLLFSSADEVQNIKVQNKDFSSSMAGSADEVLHDEVDSDVMARLRILRRRGDVGLNAESVLPNFYSLGFAMEPRGLHLHAGSSEWEHVLKDELLFSGNSPMDELV